MRNVSVEPLTIPVVRQISINKFEEFDPGSERTLAAWLRHASQTGYVIYNVVSGERVRNE